MDRIPGAQEVPLRMEQITQPKTLCVGIKKTLRVWAQKTLSVGTHRTLRVGTHRTLRVGTQLLVVGICTFAFALTSVALLTSVVGRNAPGTRDFVSYWASGHLLVHRTDPYQADAILGLEHIAGYRSGIPALIMRNPPSALVLALPLGVLGPRAAEVLWMGLLLLSLLASVEMIWIIEGRPRSQLRILGISFAPALVCLLEGQISLFILLGLVLFLRLHASRPLLAGVSLWLLMLKPHLFLPFGVVLLLWAITTRRYRMLAGVGVALGVSTATAMILDPLVWAHYARMVTSDQVARTAIPCLSITLRQSLSPDTMWLQYLPAAFGCAWAIGYFRRHRGHWDWTDHGSPLMLVSVLVAPYSWLTDQAILIPALLHAVSLTRSRGLIVILALASAAIEIGLFRGAQPFHSAFYIWTAPAWLAWYLCAVRWRSGEGVARAGPAGDGVLLAADPRLRPEVESAL